MPSPGTRRILGCTVAGLIGFGLSWAAWQSRQPEYVATPDVARDVYEAALADWLRDSELNVSANLLIAEQLTSAPEPSDSDVQGCLERTQFRPGSPTPLSSLRDVTFNRKNIRLIDEATWRADDQQLNDAVARGQFQDADLQRAFEHALIRFSQIQFDREGRSALLTFSPRCGDLCGNGFTLLMKKEPNGWTVSKGCRHWIS